MDNPGRLKRKLITTLSLSVAFLQSALSQMSIGGPTCVLTGTQYTYTISGNWTNGTTMNWVVSSGGTINGSSSGTPLPQIHVTWNSGTSGTVQAYTTSPTSSPSLTVTIATALVAGTISNTSQNINYNSLPATLNCSVATGGYCTPAYSYQWQNSPDNVNFTNISGAASQNLSFSTNLLQTTYYRRKVTETNSGSVGYSNTATVFVYPQVVGGSVSPNQTVNYNNAPSLLTLTGVSGGTNSYSYQWYYSADATNWTLINGAVVTTYLPPALTATTYYHVSVTSNGAVAVSNMATITVNPQVFGGAITPGYITINTGTSPGAINTASPASGGGCSGSYTYQWQSSTDGVSFSNISGATALSYIPGSLSAGTWYRRQVNCSGDLEYSNTCQVTISSGTPDMNFVRVRSILKAGVTDSATAAGLTSPNDVSQSTQYFDGLSRVVQTVGMQQTPLQKDIVSFDVYDNYGREADKYLPYPATTSDGNYKVTAQSDQYSFNAVQYAGEQYYYSQVSFEPSPLNRALSTYAPGINWAGAARGMGEQYLVNQASDSVRIWNIAYPIGSIPASTAAYPAGMLHKTITTDEAGHQVVEYKDMAGHVILKKAQLAASPGTAHAGWLCTYYVYDEMNYLRFVIQPQGVVAINATWSISTAIANELCFRYEYDAHSHMITKKIPGAGEAWMVYDIRDRLVMTQDSLLRSQQKWLFTRYDAENRPDSTGLITDPANYNHLAYHDTTAFKTNNYPVVTSYTNELLTQAYYDDYNWVSGTGTSIGSAIASNVTSNSSYFNTSYNTSPVYSVAITPLYITRGMATGSMKKVIGTTNQYLYSVSFYDDRGRMIQTQGINCTGAIDTVTSQYDFAGKPIRSLIGHRKNGNTVQNHTVLTKMDYDNGFRLRHIYKNIDAAASDQLIDSMQYNDLGQLRAKYIGNNIDSLVYDYNIRGWLMGINKNYVAGTTSHYFGMELGYDKSSSAAPGNTYTTQEYNGNIEGTVWKSAGSGVNRKYDFVYDNVNRLTAANFTQYNGSGFDVSAGVDFTASNLSYDANGNILSMNQKGFLVGGSTLIDQLTYSYQANSNKLSQVTDAVNNPTSKLGDFHYIGSKGSYDYTYDGNGNLSIDNNKAIDNITYNYLNLPQLVHLNTKGNIAYTYDAAGGKIKKVTMDSTSRHSTTTLYLSGFVYQQTDTISNPGGNIDTLQFIAHEEGRARWAYHKYTTGTTAYKFEYDFFEKDHLGNTRMVLTQEKDTSNYLASMEAAYRANESQLFGNIASTSYAWSSVPGSSGIPSGTKLAITNPNDSVSKVDYNGTSGQKTGPSLLLKVMSGDTVSVLVQSYYNTNSITTTNTSLTDVVNSLAAGLVSTATGNAEGTLAGFESSSGPVYAAISSFLPTKDPAPPSGYPKAYLNWVFLDDQFNYVSGSSSSVLAASTTYPPATLNTVAPGAPLTMPKNGYLYIWVSNETQGWDVFFDNLSVQYKQGAILEENHYYPFGLTMAGISDKAVKSQYAENKYRYNGKELQNKEFSDGTGLEEYDYGARFYDAQIGRWLKTDRKAELYQNITPYAYAANQPTNAIDPDGNLVIFINGFTINNTEKGTQWYWREWENTKVYDKQIPGLPYSLYHFEPRQTGSAYDVEISKVLHDDHKHYVDGEGGYLAGLRYLNGFDKGYDEAAALIASLHRTNGVIDETIKIITHSMGGLYGSGYVAGIKKYLDEHPELKHQVKITLVADLDPFEASYINNDGTIKKQQFLHHGKGSATGWLANEKESDPENYELHESPTEGSHLLGSFINDFKSLKEGTYVWNEATKQFEWQDPNKKNKK
jgi:RHS repeat-associated protein